MINKNIRRKKWDFFELKRELIVDDRNDRPIKDRIAKKRKQSKGWKADFTKVVDWGPYDGKKVLKKLAEVA